MQAELRVLQNPDEIRESHYRCMHQLPIGIGKVTNFSEIESNFAGFTADFSATAPVQARGGCPVTMLLPLTPVRFRFFRVPTFCCHWFATAHQVFSVGLCMYRMLRPDSVNIDNGTGLEEKGVVTVTSLLYLPFSAYFSLSACSDTRF